MTSSASTLPQHGNNGGNRKDPTDAPTATSPRTSTKSVEPFTPTKVAELNDQYAELQAQRHQPTVKHEDAAMQDQEEGALRALQGKGSKGPAQRRSQ